MERGYHHLHGSPVYGRSRSGAHLYIWGEEDNLHSLSYDRATHFNPKAGKSRVRAPEGMPGAILSLSANGDHDGVLWAALPLDEDAFITTVRGVLRAFDAITLEEIWSTAAADPNDRFSFAKFCPPSVVYLAPHFRTVSTSTDSGRRPRPGLQIGHGSHTAPKTPVAQRKALSAIRQDLESRVENTATPSPPQ